MIIVFIIYDIDVDVNHTFVNCAHLLIYDIDVDINHT